MRVTPFELERFYVEWEFVVGTNISSSCGAETTTMDLLDMAGPDARKSYLSLGLGYRENRGDERLRELIAEQYKNCSADEVQLTCGGSEAIFLLMQTQLSPGDRVVVEYPIYQSLFQVAADLGAQVETLPLIEEEGFVPDPERLSDLLKQKKTKMIVINHPHSPTGSILTDTIQKQIIGICEKHGVLLVSDEVYWGAFYDKSDRIPHAADLSEAAVTIGDMTKPYGLGGLRVGWLVSKQKDILGAASSMKDYTTMCAAGPSEFLSTLALTHRDRIIARNIDIASKNIAAFDEVVKGSGGRLSWVKPAGGYTGFVKLNAAGMDARDFALRLIKAKDVLVLPGDVFGDPTRFRIGVGTPRSEFVKGIEALSDFVKGL
jgi:aspartate/methionine/tyrosine aminotransferase